MCIQPSMVFKIWFRGLSKLHVFLRDGPFDIQGGGLGFFLATSYFFSSFCTKSNFFEK